MRDSRPAKTYDTDDNGRCSHNFVHRPVSTVRFSVFVCLLGSCICFSHERQLVTAQVSGKSNYNSSVVMIFT